MSPVPLCLEKWGVMTPPPSSYGSAARVAISIARVSMLTLDKNVYGTANYLK